MSRAAPILLVEDNPIEADLARRAFIAHGSSHPLLVMRDGEEALAWLDRRRPGEPLPAVILLDLKLPRMGGLEVLARIKGHARYRAIPVAILSTSAEDCDVQEAYGLGANSYIVKPVNFEQFMEIAEIIEVYWCTLNRSSN